TRGASGRQRGFRRQHGACPPSVPGSSGSRACVDMFRASCPTPSAQPAFFRDWRRRVGSLAVFVRLFDADAEREDDRVPVFVVKRPVDFAEGLRLFFSASMRLIGAGASSSSSGPGSYTSLYSPDSIMSSIHFISDSRYS